MEAQNKNYLDSSDAVMKEFLANARNSIVITPTADGFKEQGKTVIEVPATSDGVKKLTTELQNFDGKLCCRADIIMPLSSDSDRDRYYIDEIGRLKKMMAYRGMAIADYMPKGGSSPFFGCYRDSREALADPAKHDMFMEKIKGIKTPYEIFREEYGVYEGVYEDYYNRKEVKRYATGFYDLDVALNSGLKAGFICFGGLQSIGKTTFANQIAIQMAMEGHDVLFLSLEQTRDAIIHKMLSYYSYRLNPSMALTESDIDFKQDWKDFPKEKMDFVDSVYKEFLSSGYIEHLHVYHSRLTVEGIRESIEHYHSMEGKYPVVFVDYLQYIVMDDDKKTRRDNIDDELNELVDMSKEFDTPIILISALNRECTKQNYVTASGFKESGTIEYSADYLFGLQFSADAFDPNISSSSEYNDAEKKSRDEREIQKAKQKDIRNVELVVLKQRGGKIPEPIRFNYNAKFNFFEVDGLDHAWTHGDKELANAMVEEDNNGQTGLPFDESNTTTPQLVYDFGPDD